MNNSDQSISVDVKVDICKKSNNLNMEICLELMEEMYKVVTDLTDISTRISEMYLRLRSDSMLINPGFMDIKKHKNINLPVDNLHLQEKSTKNPEICMYSQTERPGYTKYLYTSSYKKHHK